MMRQRRCVGVGRLVDVSARVRKVVLAWSRGAASRRRMTTNDVTVLVETY